MPDHQLALSRSAWRQISDLLTAYRQSIDPVSWSHRTSYWWSSSVFSLTDQLQIASRAEDLASLRSPETPLFVTGFWRSGTTLLHELLCTDPQFGFATTAQCMNPSTMLLPRSRHGKGKVEKRPMDDMILSASSPQEDEFALLALGAPSPYQVLLVPTAIEHAVRLLRPTMLTRTEAIRLERALMDFRRRLALLDPRPPVLKSPTHSFRMRWLAELFPGARFVFITREPIATFGSNVKLWHALFLRYALTTWSQESLESLVVLAYEALAESIVEARNHIGRHQLVEIAYEDLAADPIGTMKELYVRLNLTAGPDAEAGWRRYVNARSDHKVGSYQKLSPQSPNFLERMKERAQVIRPASRG